MRLARFFLSAIVISPVAAAAVLDTPCLPCAGIAVSDGRTAEELAERFSAEPEGAAPFVSWTVSLDEAFDTGTVRRVRSGGMTPWLTVMFHTPAPLDEHGEELDAELERLVTLVRATGPGIAVQLVWPAGVGAADEIEQYVYLVKRAAVAVAGADPGSAALVRIPADETSVREMAERGLGVYVAGLVVREGPEPVDEILPLLAEVFPGMPLVVEAASSVQQPMVEVARNAASGAVLTFFESPDRADARLFEAVSLIDREFSGDLTPDLMEISGLPAWAFVREEDLGLRIVVDPGDKGGMLFIPDLTLVDPQVVSADGSSRILPWRRRDDGIEIDIPAGDPVVLRIGRMAAIDLGGFASTVDVGGTRTMPVEEILQRLQAFEDAQARKLDHYEAVYTQYLRYRPGARMEPIEVSFSGPFFFRQGRGFDWVWKEFMVAGVRWKGKIPELPLIQPARAAAMPLEINLDRRYVYRLKGTAVVEGRDCWEVEFEPVDGRSETGMWKGTVWVDREVFARVKTRALQLGLTGEVLSNEETTFFEPVDAGGRKVGWNEEGFVLPTRVAGQELQSILNGTVQVVKESRLTKIRINRQGFDERLRTAYSSEDTMVRDTPEGMRYLQRREDGSRVVQEGFDEDRYFGLAGGYYDASYDYPVPMVGIDYFSNDFLGTGSQVNFFFAGVFLNANLADPSFLGSRWDAGVRLGGMGLAAEENLYRNGEEIEGEEVDSRWANLDLFLGHPLGAFGKIDLTCAFDYEDFGRSETTADDFVLPQDTLTRSLGLELTYSRGGYRLSGRVFSFNRSNWEPWGLPGNGEYDPAAKDYLRWRIGLAKSWWVTGLTKLSLRYEHLDGRDLDRFSKYGFDTFGDSRVAGYQRGLITASNADVVHLGYGFNLADVLRIELRGDAAWATDETTGLDRELLAGVSLNGTVIGPWQTVINFDIGVPVEGPADEFTASIVVLKLF